MQLRAIRCSLCSYDHMQAALECIACVIATNDAIHTRAKLPDLQNFSLDRECLIEGWAASNMQKNKRAIAHFCSPFKFAPNVERYKMRSSAPLNRSDVKSKAVANRELPKPLPSTTGPISEKEARNCYTRSLLKCS
jgi:hypothetical protein